MDMKKILVIGVIYNTFPETLRYIRSVRDQAANVDIILADNSDQQKPAQFREELEPVTGLYYFETGSNLGYFGAARVALDNYLKTNQGFPEWILVTNVDIEFTPGFFQHLSSEKAEDTTGLLAPSILSSRWRSDYNPQLTRRYSRARMQMFRLIYSSCLLHNFYLCAAYAKKWLRGRAVRMSEPVGKNPTDRVTMYAAHGSCMVFSKNYFLLGGTLNMPNFLFGEEIFVAETARELGLEILYTPKLVILDHEHASTGFFIKPLINRYYRESIATILKNYYE
jgi:GT2 family glycosyltransferase